MKKKIINGILLVALMLTATTSFVSCKDNVDDELSTVYANLAKQKSELETKITNLTTTVNTLQSTVTDLQGQVNQNTTNIATNAENIATNAENIANNAAAILIVANEVDSIEGVIDSLSTALKAIDERLTNVENDVKKLQEDMTALDNRVTALENEMANIEKKIQSMINNVVVDLVANNTINRVIGTWNTPGLNAKVLAAFFGENMTSISKFPVTGTARNIYPDDEYHVVYPEEIADSYSFDITSKVITDDNYNAGKLFFTVSTPDTKNFNIDGWNLTLENSQGKTAKVTFSNVTPSTYLIHWGFFKSQTPWLNTAATETNENGFFMADATIAKEDLLNNSFGVNSTFNLSELKNDLKNAIDSVRNTKGNYNKLAVIATEAAQLIKKFYTNHMSNDYRQTSNATWFPQQLVMTKQINDSTTYRVQTSEYDIALTAVKPLSYNSFIELEKKAGDKFSLSRLETAIRRLAEKIKAKLPNITLSKVKIAEIKAIDNKFMYVKLMDEDYKTYEVKTVIYEPIIAAINSGLSEIDLTKAIQGLDKINKLGTDVDNYTDRLTAAINKLSGKIIQSFKQHQYTRALAPCIYFEGAEGIDRLQDGIKVNKGTMVAYMSSPTEELLAPAYKKYLAITDPSGKTIGRVYDGSVQKELIDLSTTGDYNIILSCVDYYGYICTKRYLVHVVD